MSTWKIDKTAKDRPKNPILIEGLPGIGNVGKIAVDFLISELKAKKLYEIWSYTFPHSVFVNEKNLVDLPKIEIYYKKMPKNDLLFLAGDIQPVDEVSSYEFCEKILDILQQYKGKEIITLGGIGLAEMPKKPRVFCTANDKEIINKYKKDTEINDKIYGVVGPIIGVSGLLLGLAEKRKIKAIALLAETLGHPLYLGVKGAREELKILNKKLNLKLNLKKLDKEIKDIEGELIRKTRDISAVSKQIAFKKLGKRKETSYIG